MSEPKEPSKPVDTKTPESKNPDGADEKVPRGKKYDKKAPKPKKFTPRFIPDDEAIKTYALLRARGYDAYPMKAINPHWNAAVHREISRNYIVSGSVFNVPLHPEMNDSVDIIAPYDCGQLASVARKHGLDCNVFSIGKPWANKDLLRGAGVAAPVRNGIPVPIRAILGICDVYAFGTDAFTPDTIAKLMSQHLLPINGARRGFGSWINFCNPVGRSADSDYILWDGILYQYAAGSENCYVHKYSNWFMKTSVASTPYGTLFINVDRVHNERADVSFYLVETPLPIKSPYLYPSHYYQYVEATDHGHFADGDVSDVDGKFIYMPFVNSVLRNAPNRVNFRNTTSMMQRFETFADTAGSKTMSRVRKNTLKVTVGDVGRRFWEKVRNDTCQYVLIQLKKQVLDSLLAWDSEGAVLTTLVETLDKGDLTYGFWFQYYFLCFRIWLRALLGRFGLPVLFRRAFIPPMRVPPTDFLAIASSGGFMPTDGEPMMLTDSALMRPIAAMAPGRLEAKGRESGRQNLDLTIPEELQPTAAVLLLTSAPPSCPSKTDHSYYSALAHRVARAPQAEEKKEWTVAVDIVRGVFPKSPLDLINLTPVEEKALRHYFVTHFDETWKRNAYTRAYVELYEDVGDDVKNAMEYTMSSQVKIDEFLFAKAQGHLRAPEPGRLKPRLIVYHKRNSQINTFLYPDSTMIESFLKQQLWNGSKDVRCFYASGAGPADLTNYGRLCDEDSSHRVFMTVAGDDSHAKVRKGNSTFHVMSDFSRFDSTHTEASTEAGAALLLAWGIPLIFINFIRSAMSSSIEYRMSNNRKYKYNRGSPFFRSGLLWTTIWNGMINFIASCKVYLTISTNGALNLDRQTVTAEFAKLGLIAKVTIKQSIIGADFLKGWFVTGQDQKIHWVPLPSRVCKAVALKLHNKERFRVFTKTPSTGARVLRCHASAVANSLEEVGDPIVDALKRLYRRLGTHAQEAAEKHLRAFGPVEKYSEKIARETKIKSTHLRDNVKLRGWSDAAIPKGLYGNVRPKVKVERSEYFELLRSRYTITVEEVESFEAMLDSVVALPSTAFHRVWQKLAIVDYGFSNY